MRTLPAALALLLATVGAAAPALAGPFDCNGARVPPDGDHGAWADVCPRDHAWQVGYVGADQVVLAQNCPAGAIGVAVEVDGAIGHVCITVIVEPPSELPDVPANSFEVVSCSIGQGGFIINVTGGTFKGTMAGLCIFYAFEVPHEFGDPMDPGLTIDLTDCSFGGTDPAIGAFGGGVAICFVHFLVIDPVLPPFDPGIGLSLDPCEGGADPSVFIVDGRIVVCIEARVPS